MTGSFDSIGIPPTDRQLVSRMVRACSPHDCTEDVTMGLYKRGKFWWIAFTENGKLVRKSTKQTSKDKANELWSRLTLSRIDGSYVPEERRARPMPAPPFELALKSYLADRSQRGRNDRSYEYLERRWLPELEGRSVADITTEEIETCLASWTTANGWSNATRNQVLAQLSGFLTYCVRRRWRSEHGIKERLERFPETKRDRWLRRHELDAIKEHCEPWLKNVLDFAAVTGIRFALVCDLRRANYQADDAGNAYVVVERDKNGETLYKSLHGTIRAAIEERVKACKFPGDYLLPGPKGGNPYSSIRRKFKVAVEKAAKAHPDYGLNWGAAGDGITFHTLRHTMASAGRNAGVSEGDVQAAGNWKSSRMMKRYAHLGDDRLREAEARITAAVVGPLHTASQRETKGRKNQRVKGSQPVDSAGAGART